VLDECRAKGGEPSAGGFPGSTRDDRRAAFVALAHRQLASQSLANVIGTGKARGAAYNFKNRLWCRRAGIEIVHRFVSRVQITYDC
jgi:hypothetical protein